MLGRFLICTEEKSQLGVCFTNFEVAKIACIRGALRTLLLAFRYVNTFDGRKLVRDAADEAEPAIDAPAFDQDSVTAELPFEASALPKWNHTRIVLVFSHIA
jgi:hypothetical protein